MATSFAELNSRVLTALGGLPTEICSLPDAHNAVVQAHSVRAAQARHSTVNVSLSFSPEFTPNDFEFDITDYVGSGIPVGLETRGENNRFRPLEIVNRAALTDDGYLTRAAFYASTENGNARQMIAFGNIPEFPVRIVFDADTVEKSIGANISLPDTVSELIVIEAQQALIPRIKLKIAMNMNRTEQERKDAQFIAQSFSELFQANQMRLPDLIALWKVWAFSERSSESKFNRPMPSGRRMYGD